MIEYDEINTLKDELTSTKLAKKFLFTRKL